MVRAEAYGARSARVQFPVQPKFNGVAVWRKRDGGNGESQKSSSVSFCSKALGQKWLARGWPGGTPKYWDESNWKWSLVGRNQNLWLTNPGTKFDSLWEPDEVSSVNRSLGEGLSTQRNCPTKAKLSARDPPSGAPEISKQYTCLNDRLGTGLESYPHGFPASSCLTPRDRERAVVRMCCGGRPWALRWARPSQPPYSRTPTIRTG